MLEVFFLDPAVHFKRADCRDQHHAIGRNAGFAALDVKEFLCPEIGAETGFGHDIVGELERGRGRQYPIAAVRDVGERSAVNERGGAFQRLHQIGRQRLLEQNRHRAMRLEIAGAHWFAVTGVAGDDIAQAFFRSSRSRARPKIAMTSDATVMSKPSSRGKPLATPPSEFTIERSARSFIWDAAPGDASRIDAERIAPIDMVVEQRREQVVRRRDGVEVAGEVQINVLHRHDLGIAAAGRTALHAERRAERRLADA